MWVWPWSHGNRTSSESARALPFIQLDRCGARLGDVIQRVTSSGGRWLVSPNPTIPKAMAWLTGFVRIVATDV